MRANYEFRSVCKFSEKSKFVYAYRHTYMQLSFGGISNFISNILLLFYYSLHASICVCNITCLHGYGFNP